jgi:hypothetical protein
MLVPGWGYRPAFRYPAHPDTKIQHLEIANRSIVAFVNGARTGPERPADGEVSICVDVLNVVPITTICEGQGATSWRGRAGRRRS